jgi:4-alpha-glucanotransferase
MATLCPQPPAPAWGWAVQLYAVRSRASWGIGDLADLRRLGEWASGLGAGFIQVNPLMAAHPLQASPYYPSSRRFLSPLYLRIEDIPGAGNVPELASLAAQGRALNQADSIDREAIFRLKRQALDLLWSRASQDAAGGPAPGSFADPECQRFLRDSGSALRQFALYCALAEAHGYDWKAWPGEFRHPDSPAIGLFAEKNGSRIAFHQWVQWLLDLQLERASKAIPLVQDLPIGFDPGGADAWVWQDMLALGVSVGAPPDGFNAEGQDWGLPPFIPQRLREDGYGPLRGTFKAVLRHAKGLRIDHAMGLFRLFWIPRGAKPSQGIYIRYPHEEILEVLRSECAEAGVFVIGEDLGTVEPGVRKTLSEWGILGSKVLWFESDPPSAFPKAALASVTTHDLPTLAGKLQGSDDEEQKSLGLPVDAEASRKVTRRILDWAGVPADADPGTIACRVHRLLAQSPAILVAATLDDALGATRRPNLPGTDTERPNWKIPLPKTLEEIETDPGVMKLAATLDRPR